MRRRLRRIGELARINLERFAVILSSVFLVGLTTWLVSLTVVQISLSMGVLPPSLATTVCNFFLSILMNLEDPASLEKLSYASIVSTWMTAIVVLVTIWFAIVPIIGYFRLRKKFSIQKERVYEDGTDDLRLMLRFYEAAERITVFSGDFSWICDESEQSRKLKNKVERLAKEDKIRLVSYKSKDAVEASLGPSWDELQHSFTFINGITKPLKCSLIEYGGVNSTFLYKDTTGMDASDSFILILKHADDSRYILSALRTMIEKLVDDK